MTSQNNEELIIGRFGRNASLSNAKNIDKNKIIRIWSKKTGKTNNGLHLEFVPCATDGETIVNKGKEIPIRDFFELIYKQKKNPIFLTTKELQLSAFAAVDFNITPASLEKSYPIFRDIKFYGTPRDRERTLIKKLDVLKSLQVKGRTALELFANESQFRIERSIRSKNGLDKFFAFLEKDPYQEAFKFTEERIDRVVIAMDYNSMYGSCMDGYFPDPKYLEYRDHQEKKNGQLEENIPVKLGIYRVTMAGINSDFLSNFGPFKEKILGKSIPIKADPKAKIESIITSEELEYYRKFFNEIKIIESITSRKKIRHPLFKLANRLYRQRKNAKYQSKHELEKLLKLKIASLHSCTNIKKYKFKKFPSPHEALKFLEENFNFTAPKNLTEIDALLLASKQKIIRFKIERGLVNAKIIDLASAESLHSLSSLVISRARLKLLMLIEHLQKETNIEICYANSDSVHISTKKTSLNETLYLISKYESEEMGGLRVQCIADRGYWLEPGRYWLMKDNDVIKFANKTFNHPGSTNPFITKRKKITKYHGENLSFIRIKYFSLYKQISLSKKLEENLVDNQDFSRYTLSEVRDLEVASGPDLNQSKDLITPRIELIKRIATDIVSKDSALRAQTWRI